MWRGVFGGAAAVGIAFAAACSSFTGDAPTNPTIDDAGSDVVGDDFHTTPPMPGPPFCSTVDASFCWSFDDDSGGPLFADFGTPPHGSWTRTNAATSPPFAARITANGPSPSALTYALADGLSKVTCSAQVSIASASKYDGTDKPFDLLGMSTKNQSAYAVVAEITSDGTYNVSVLIVTPDILKDGGKDAGKDGFEIVPIGNVQPSTYNKITIVFDSDTKTVGGSVGNDVLKFTSVHSGFSMNDARPKDVRLGPENFDQLNVTTLVDDIHCDFEQ